jgi:DnaJ homologue, subfamily C, member 28, conserved domain
MELMTERKPPGMSFRSWVDQQVAEAEERGVFRDLPGAGKPLDLSGEGDFTERWVREYVRREGASFEDALPLPLRLRKESERLAESAGQFPSEAAVRAAAADLNRRILDWRRIPVGPPVYVRLCDEEALASAWREARARRLVEAELAAREAGLPAAGARRAGWLRRLRRRRPAAD